MNNIIEISKYILDKENPDIFYIIKLNDMLFDVFKKNMSFKNVVKNTDEFNLHVHKVKEIHLDKYIQLWNDKEYYKNIYLYWLSYEEGDVFFIKGKKDYIEDITEMMNIM